MHTQPGRRVLRLLAALLATSAFGCDAPPPDTPATLDFFASELEGQCTARHVTWRGVEVGAEQYRGFRMRPNERCQIALTPPAASTLTLRVMRLPDTDQVGPLRARLLAYVGATPQRLEDAALEPGEAQVIDAVPLPAGTTRLVFEVIGGGRRASVTPVVAWTDLRLTTRDRSDLDASRFAIPLAEALADYFASPDAPAPPSDETHPRFLLIGIDGASWPLLDGLMAEGLMPNLAALRARGRYGRLESTVIPESAMAWTTILTGVGPGKHGVTNFLSADTPRSSFWRWLSDAGLRSIVLGVPKARTNEDFEGLMVGGWNWSRDRRYARPAAFKAALDRAHYDPAIVYLRNTDYFAERMAERTDLFLALASATDWDQAFVVYEYSDTAGHLFGLGTEAWKRSYAAVDREVGRLLAFVDPRTTVMLVSDHGWKRYAGSVSAEPWLEAHGFDHWSTHIYSGNRVGLRRQPRASEADEVVELDAIAAALSDIREPATGRGLVRRLIPASEAFAGPFAESTTTRAIVDLVPDHHAVTKERLSDVVVEAPIDHHAMSGFYLIAGPDVEAGEGRDGSVVDVAPTVAGFFGVAPPEDVDGRSLLGDTARPPHPRVRAGTKAAAATSPKTEPEADDAQSDEDLRERLRALGYVDE